MIAVQQKINALGIPPIAKGIPAQGYILKG
jgi:hypothetical protein